MSDKPGPVYVEISSSMLSEDIGEIKYKVYYSVSRPLASPNDVKTTVDLICSAEYPVILVDRGVRISHATNEVIKVAETINAPIVTTVMAKDAIPSNHPLYAGVAIGRAGNIVAYEVLRKADVILSVGNRFSEIGTGRYSLEINGELIHVNVDPYDLGRAYKPRLAVLADAKDFLTKVLQELSLRGRCRGEGV
ncbi:thiamine pyrophosphate-binding protein [Caldivirga maquilingensis]|uniref:thiamine pyrophosphate-binding protein n=1 Tax=Caldivirga maquilingensis TaxID=76887 RepID=UPI0000F24D68